MRRPHVSIEFAPGDLWVGVYVKRERALNWRRTRWTVYVCIVPCLPIRVRWVGPMGAPA